MTTATATTTRRYPDEHHNLFLEFVEFFRDWEDEEAEYRADYEPRGGRGKTVPAIVTSADPVTLGMRWYEFCQREGVHHRTCTKLAPTASDAMGMERIWHP